VLPLETPTLGRPRPAGGSHCERPDPRQGIFFIVGDGTARREEVAAFISLSEIILTVPSDLPSGSYRLELRAVILLRDDLQSGTLPELILVVAEDSG